MFSLIINLVASSALFISNIFPVFFSRIEPLFPGSVALGSVNVKELLRDNKLADRR